MMNDNGQWARLETPVIAHIIGFIVFLCVWVIGCYAADEIMHLPADSWRMLFGFVVGSVGLFLQRAAVVKCKTINRRGPIP